jgi:hypothetical protein
MSDETQSPTPTAIDSDDWQRVALFLLLKLAGRGKTVTLKSEEMEKLIAEFQPGIPVLLTTGHLDGMSLVVVDEETAQRLAAQPVEDHAPTLILPS